MDGIIWWEPKVHTASEPFSFCGVGHYIQQAFLRHWEDPGTPDFIWTYIRGVPEPRLLPIEKVAQSPGFYDPNVERDLATLVEGPTKPILDLLRRGEDVGDAGRTAVAVYAATCLKRVPRHRERGMAMIPDMLEIVVERTRGDLPALAGGDPVREEKLRADLDAVHAKYRVEPPQAVVDQIHNPRPTHEQVDVIRRMAWRLLITDASEPFLTSDNNLFYFEDLGLGRETSEFAFPISPTHCLHGCFQPLRLGGTIETRNAERPLVHEINRRMANNATKLLFANIKAKFPITLLSKGHGHYLSRINWTY